jgi:hypothetical protein
MARVKALIADDIVPALGLQRSSMRFWCPFCGHWWMRGGKKEGFVKSGANNHVAACWEIVLFRQGYLLGPHLQTRGRTAIRLVDAKEPYHPRVIRAIKGLIASRRRAGLFPLLPAGGKR